MPRIYYLRFRYRDACEYLIRQLLPIGQDQRLWVEKITEYLLNNKTLSEPVVGISHVQNAVEVCYTYFCTKPLIQNHVRSCRYEIIRIHNSQLRIHIATSTLQDCCKRATDAVDDILAVTSAFDTPRFRYDDDLKKFVSDKESKRRLFDVAESKAEQFAFR